jgi:hypothetical protein
MTNAQVDMVVIKVYATSFELCPGRYSQKHTPLCPAPGRLQGPSLCRSRHSKGRRSQIAGHHGKRASRRCTELRCASQYSSMLLLQADGGVVSDVPKLELHSSGDAVPRDLEDQRIPAMQFSCCCRQAQRSHIPLVLSTNHVTTTLFSVDHHEGRQRRL